MKYSDIIENNDIRYIIYIDASGDDGFDFRESRGDGSSPCYTVAAFLTAVEDIPHNIQVLNNAKRLFGHTDNKSELKYTKVRRHFNACKIHDELLDNLKGTLLIENAFKQYDIPASDKAILSSLCHSFPISLLSSYFLDDWKHFCIVIDHMKAVEENLVTGLLKMQDSRKTIESHICYMDSKDKNAPLIQVADFFAGMYRNFFEELYTDREVFNKIMYSCYPCRQCALMLKHRYKRKCLFTKSKIKIPYTSYIKKSTRLLKKDAQYGFTISVGILSLPVHLCQSFSFIDCKLNDYCRKIKK